MQARGSRRRKPPSPGERVHGDLPADRRSAWEAVYALVRRIPRGRVMTYGQISGLLAGRLSPLAVGWAMHDCPDNVPWHRVVNARGEISLRPTIGYHEQRAQLEEEGVKINRAGKIDLKIYGWKKI